jgi:primosomal protein N' (replication factor Y)
LKNALLFASVAVESTLFHFDKEFSYSVPENLVPDVRPGVKVLVPFGASNRKICGFVLSVFEKRQTQAGEKIKFILDVNSKNFALSDEFLSLVKWMKSRYYCTFFDAVRVVAFADKASFKNQKMDKILKPNLSSEEKKMTEKQKIVFKLLKKEKNLTIKNILYSTGFTSSVVYLMIKKGMILCEAPGPKEILSAAKVSNESGAPWSVVLTSAQQEVFANIVRDLDEKKLVSLLYGVTGSGKTLVFLELIKEILNRGRTAILMVPEIALTSQLMGVFCKEFKSQVAILNSSLSRKERLRNWQRIKNGEAKIVVGTRSAVFAPLKKIGLIIMDEEHETSYKSESTPRYHAREVAIFRCKYHCALLLLASATPSVESFFMAKNGRYGFSKLEQRYKNVPLPTVSIVDMTCEESADDAGVFSKKLVDAIKINSKAKKQSIILLNRRGYSTFVVCPSCKNVAVCKNCSISMSYHAANNRLMCHYCSCSKELSDECLYCHKSQVHCMGVGTQKVESELRKLAPDVRILRIDSDSTAEKSLLAKKIKSFKNGDYDVLVGTQMVAKGLDFPRVTLVGIISVDSMLYSGDFRSYERTFDIITQVVGRSGRGACEGRAIIQTLTPENPIIKFAADQNYEAFYHSEIQMREAMLYPPFARICVVGFLASSEKRALDASRLFCKMLVYEAKESYKDLPLRVLGPSPACILKVNKKYRYKIIIKFRDCERFRSLMSYLKLSFAKAQKGVSVFIDTSPNSIP